MLDDLRDVYEDVKITQSPRGSYRVGLWSNVVGDERRHTLGVSWEQYKVLQSLRFDLESIMEAYFTEGDGLRDLFFFDDLLEVVKFKDAEITTPESRIRELYVESADKIEDRYHLGVAHGISSTLRELGKYDAIVDISASIDKE